MIDIEFLLPIRLNVVPIYNVYVFTNFIIMTNVPTYYKESLVN